MTAYRTLRRDEAEARAALLAVEVYDVRLDLASDEATFDSVTTVTFRSGSGETFLDLKPASVRRIDLDGVPVDVDTLEAGRLPLALAAGQHELRVEAVMRFRNDGEGLHRAVDPADGRHYVYGMSFMEAAPSVFACFDQPDLKAPVTLHVRAPVDWLVVANGPGAQVEPGVWEFEQTPPLSTYFVTLVAGPYHHVRDVHDGIPLGLLCRTSIARDLDADADELFRMTRQCFDEFHRLFGIRYQFGEYHQAFVPEFNAGAMENPGCVTFRDPLVFSSKVTRGKRITRATTVAHEMAHQWFGNLTTPLWWDDLWLNESFAEYMGVRVTADVTEFGDAWTNHAYSRRQWGLVADRRPSTHPVAGNGAVDAASALTDFDGISYSKGAAVLKQLNARIGDEVFFAGVTDHFRSHWLGNATMHDLFSSWERAGAGDLSDFTTGWLRTAGVDRLDFDRASATVVRTPPELHPADRHHVFRAISATPGQPWATREVRVGSTPGEYAVPAGAAVVLDPCEDTWAVPHLDEVTVAALPVLLPGTTDPTLRAGVWNSLASTFHDAALDPLRYLDVVDAAIPEEPADDALAYRLRAIRRSVPALCPDPRAALGRVHLAALARLRTASPGSVLQLAAFENAVSSAADVGLLTAWRDGADLPPGLELDLELRWRILTRLATLGATDRAELRRHLDAEPTAVSTVAHVKAVCSLPDADAKAFAWAHFTGEIDAPNYELEAAGLGLWRAGQESVTAPYVPRYFAELPATTAVREGWVLGDAAASFFPLTALDDETLRLARDLLARDDLEASLRRSVVDLTDELERRLVIRSRFGR